jgi:hypothetical protein
MVPWEYGFEGLLILLEPSGIHIGHIIRKHLHAPFMGECSRQDRIDTSIHIADSFCLRETATLMPDSFRTEISLYRMRTQPNAGMN